MPLNPPSQLELTASTSGNLTAASAALREEVLDLLKDLVAHYTAYHNHKETMAWAGVVLFSGLSFALATLLKDHTPTADLFHGTGSAIALAVLLATITCCVYLQKQFELRKRAADLVAACIWLRGKLLSNPITIIVPSDWAPRRLKPGERMQSNYVLPEAVLSLASEVASFGQRSRIVLESCAYAFVFGLATFLLTRA